MKEKNSLALSGFPYQKRSYKEKTPKFYETCVEAGIQETINSSRASSTGVRTSRKNKVVNYNLYNDIVDKREMDKAINPYGLSTSNFPATYRNYPLVNPNINLLCGEERKRIFNPTVIVLSDDAVTERLDKIKELFAQEYAQLVQDTSLDEKEIEKRLNKFSKFTKYEYKDLRERMGTQVLNYLYYTLDLKEEFSRGFKDALIAAEEIYTVEIWGGEPRLRKCNPLNIITIRAGESWKIEDSDIIIEDLWMSRGAVIDRYYDHLKSADITKIEEAGNSTTTTTSGIFREQLLNNGIEGAVFYDMDDPEQAALAGGYFDSGYDSEGNVRVTKVTWAGLKKLYFIKYIDEFGKEQEEVLSEQYEIDKSLGEEITERWVKVWYEGTKIGNDTYVKLGPCEFQMRHRDNYSICYPPYVGTIYNVNSSKGRSIIDISKDYQYLWNTFWYKTELAFAKYKGKIGKLNLHLIPDFQDVESALHFAESTGWMLQDKFNESNRGMSKGKLAGAMNEGSDVIDMEMGNYIQHHVNMLRYIKEQVDELIGITPQRRGSIDNRETVGGVERSVMQSSHITEEWFSIHENTRVRALRLLLEAAKIAWKGKGFTREFVLDDGTKSILDFDYDSFAEASYGVDVSNSSNDAQALQAIKSLGERLTQAQGGLTLFAETLRAKDFASVYRKIADFEENLAMQQQEQQQAEMQQQQQAVEMQAQMEQERMAIEIEQKQLDRELRQYEVDTNNETKITIAELNTYIGLEERDLDNNGIPDTMEIAAQGLKEREHDSKTFLAQMEQRRKEKETSMKESNESKKLSIQEKELALEEKKMNAANKLKEKELALKERDSQRKLKIAKSNKNKYDK